MVGVLANRNVTIVFSERMDAASTEAAIQTNLPSVSYAWNFEGDTLTIDPIDLAYSTPTDT